MSERIELNTPPKKLSLDDSNFFNARLKDYKKEVSKYRISEDGDAESDGERDLEYEESEMNRSQASGLSLDEMSETDKLRHQMFKVNRRIAKLEMTNLELSKKTNWSIFISSAAVSCAVLFYIANR